MGFLAQILSGPSTNKWTNPMYSSGPMSWISASQKPSRAVSASNRVAKSLNVSQIFVPLGIPNPTWSPSQLLTSLTRISGLPSCAFYNSFPVAAHLIPMSSPSSNGMLKRGWEADASIRERSCMLYLHSLIMARIFDILTSAESCRSEAIRGRSPQNVRVKSRALNKGMYSASKGQFMKTLLSRPALLWRIRRLAAG